MITASLVCHNLDIHTLVLRRSSSLFSDCNLFLGSNIWVKYHGHFNWSISARDCDTLKKYITDLLENIKVDSFEGFNQWMSECAVCTGELCNIRLDIGDESVMDWE